jgi:iron complex outermembrane recepter protein
MAIRVLSGASALAMVAGMAGGPLAWAQQAPAPSPQTRTVASPAPEQAPPSQTKPEETGAQKSDEQSEKVLVTGSLIATAPENAPKPVEVYTAKDLEEQGSPTTTEFIRSLTLSYGDDLAFGQSSPDVPQGAGFGNANLRGLGSNGTLVLMNGRNLAPWNGSFGADVNTVPTEALEAVEVLKDGASATLARAPSAG